MSFITMIFNILMKDMYKISRIITIILCIALILYTAGSGQLSGWQILAGLGYGILSFLVLIPIHEAIHGIVSMLLGAKKVRFKVLWRKLAFLAEAPDFVMDFRTFFLVAVAPFFIINTLLIGLLLSCGYAPFYLLIGLSALMIHTMGCIGDFALISFFEEQKGKKIYTFDRAGSGASYFYLEL